MESTDTLKISERHEQFLAWLVSDCGFSSMTLHPMAGDASFRRYFRIYTPEQSWVAMDAPPPENCPAFVAISTALRELGLKTPEVIQADLTKGFLLLSDFGDHTYLKTLNAENADALYERALRALAALQNCKKVPNHPLPAFTPDFMLQEWAWHKEWFLEKWLGIRLKEQESALDAAFHHLVAVAARQPQVFMHRDYHSANLMVLPQDEVGILDFQDAFIGPVTYDLVSLLRDCYIHWDNQQIERWVLFYRELLLKQGHLQAIEAATFLRWFDLMGIERHLKALFTFSRKSLRDHDNHYLKHIPRTLNYIEEVSGRYPELSELHHFITTTVKPLVSRKLACEQ